jgi:hypothetical protein
MHFRCCSLHTQARPGANHPNNVRHHRRHHHLRGVVQAEVVLKVRLRIARRYTHLVCLGRDAEQSGT